jgi:hypothetical protein
VGVNTAMYGSGGIQPLFVYPQMSMYGGSLSPQHGTSSGCGERDCLQPWGVTENTLNKQSRTNDKGWSYSLGIERSANNPSS